MSNSQPHQQKERLGAGRHIKASELPEEAVISLHALTTSDGATTTGTLFTLPGAQAVATIMHPRMDTTHHYLVGGLLRAGFAVWTQNARNVGSDLTLIHEEAVLDAAAGMVFLRDAGFKHIIAVGNSGGSGLYAYYIQQAQRPAEDRIRVTPAGRPSGFATTLMPVPDAAVFLAPHPGQGELLLDCIDPSVADEDDPLSVVPEFNLFDPANGFAEPPASSHYSAEFLERYRQAQRDRVRRIDAKARDSIAAANEARTRFKQTGNVADRRVSIAPRLIIVYRTDADPRCVDLSLDPSDRPYGSVFGKRPDIINYGLVGFGRLTTAEAWLSTWSGLSSNASFRRCAPEIRIPTLVVEYTGDQVAFPSTVNEIFTLLGSRDKAHDRVRGTHFGGPITPGEVPGAELAEAVIVGWLRQRFPAEVSPSVASEQRGHGQPASL
jgi:hypothetical protein